jgi:hypothetical protein
MSNNEDRELWRLNGARAVTCVMITCCAGAELQVREDDEIVLRELYPTKSDLYERSRALENEYRAREREPDVSRRRSSRLSD